MRDGSDGAALLAVVHYYCPEQMKLDGAWRGSLWPGLGLQRTVGLPRGRR